MQRFAIACLASVLLVLFSGAAVAHGGNLNGPGKGKPNYNPGKRPGSSARAGGTTMALTPTWETWWSRNREEFFDVRQRRIDRANRRSRTGNANDGVAAPDNPAHQSATRREIRDEILPVLLKALKSPSGEIRDAAAIAVGRAGDVPELAALRKLLDDSAKTVREAAILGIGLLQNPMGEAALVDLLHKRNLSYKERSLAAIALGLSGGDRARENLSQRLGFKKPIPLVSAVKMRQLEGHRALGLGLLDSDASAGLILEALKKAKTKDRDFRAMSLTALARIGDPAAARVALRGLGGKTFQEQRSAAILLGRVLSGDDKSQVGSLVSAFSSHRDQYVRAFLAVSIGRLGGPHATAALKRMLKAEKHNEIIGFCLIGLGITKDSTLTPLLLQQLKKAKDIRLKGAAAVALGILDDDAALDTLIKQLGSTRNPDYRAHLVTAIAMLGDESHAPTIRKLLLDARGPELVRACGMALSLMSDRDAIDLLISKLKTGGSIQIKGSMATALGRIGDRRAIAGLVKIANTRSQTDLTRAFAIVALGLIGDKLPRSAFTRISIDSNYTLVDAAGLIEVLDIF